MYRDAHPDDLASIGDAAYRFATEGGVYDVVYRSKRDGEYRIIHAYGKHVYKEDGTRLAFVWYTDQGAFVADGKNEKDGILNVLKNQLAERSISIKTGHDYLTGLPSMTYFFELADAGCSKIRNSGRLPVILFTDFDGMKVYNQRYGLEEGDRVLKAFSEEIVDLFSHENCSRFSADHFCIYTDEEKAHEAVKKLIENNSRFDSEKNMPLRIGMYLYEDPSISISGACDRAIDESRIKVFYQAVVRTANGKVCHEFVIVVLDVNDLKKINDTEGHEAGDKCICDACEIICRTFKRSPVYRVGGDEFVVISQDEDYAHSEELVKMIAQHNEEALINGEIIIACGMAKYDKETCVAEVFEAADKRMYENKKYLKTRKG
ncbi:diguanylate cyclase (GGDEF) domain-containing protein [Butyrivibrio sp. INlla16]|nr:diguanylate cyclase (GGDEF) domain-containing protein [Butyrivibrio sp. INlla16]